jgi:hypothetical protein
MKLAIPYLAILLVILYGIYNALNHTPKHIRANDRNTVSIMQKETSLHARKELDRIGSPDYTYHYIINVINHGSQNLHFKEKEIMEGGFVAKEDASKVACYVLSLAGESCPVPSSKDAPMYYSSNCAGCHGEDGKGIHGTYPDLTRRPLLGIVQRMSRLKHLIQQ